MLPIETTPPRQLLMPPPPQQDIGTVLSRALGDGEWIGVGSIRTRDGGFFFFLHGADPVPSRNYPVVGASPLHHQHWHAGMWMFPVEPGSVRLLLDVGGIGRRVEELGSRHAALGFLGGDGGGEDEQHYGDVVEVCAAYRPLRLRGGAADDDYSADAVPPAFSWWEVMGYPMAQTIPGTCALVAATVCVEARHRRKFEAEHGAGTFVCRAAAPRRLRQACFRDKVWNPSSGENERTWAPNRGALGMERVLAVMQRIGGARTTNAAPPAPFFLPLKDVEQYGHDGGGGLTAETAARILYEGGPCIGTLFATSQFFDTFVVPGSSRAPAVFRGCPRENRKQVMDDDPNAAMHAVVCFAYCRTNRGRLSIFVLDNQRASGPIRCEDSEEFDEFFVLYCTLRPYLLFIF